jgi:hypothetical protein
VADERTTPAPESDDEGPDTAALLDQGEQLLAESARLLRRLDAALVRRPKPLPDDEG